MMFMLEASASQARRHIGRAAGLAGNPVDRYQPFGGPVELTWVGRRPFVTGPPVLLP